MEQGTQVRCRDCMTGWVIVNSQEDVPSTPHRLCEACIRKINSKRTEQRAQDPKRRGRPPKKNSNGSDDDDGELAIQPPPAPPAQRRPGRPLKQRFGDSLHVTAHTDQLAAPTPAPGRRGRPPKQQGMKGDDDGDKPPARPSAPPPPTRPRGRARGRAWGPPPELPTRLSTRHTRQGSELAPPPKRLKPPHEVMSSPDPLGPSREPRPIELLDSSADPLHGEGGTHSSTSRDSTPGTPDSLCDAGLLLRQFLAHEWRSADLCFSGQRRTRSR